MNPTLNAHTIIPRSFIHCRAKRAAKYMNSILHDIQIFPPTGECLKVALHSVIAPRMVQGAVRQRRLVVQRDRILESLRRVDPVTT